MGSAMTASPLRHSNQVSRIRCRNRRNTHATAPLRHLRHPPFRGGAGVAVSRGRRRNEFEAEGNGTGG